MTALANQDVDTLAAALFSKDHPDRLWSSDVVSFSRIGIASARERAVYRGFATSKLNSERMLADAADAAAALAVDVVSLGAATKTGRALKQA